MEKMKKVVISKEDLKNNLKIIKSLKSKECKIIGVVKANGMGLDLIKYSKFLIENNVKILAVAEAEEAILLRNSKILEEIILLTPINNEKLLEKLIKNKITLTLSSLGQAEIVEKISKKIKKKIDVHVKIDTGFGRYGFLYTEKENIVQIFKMQDCLNIKGVYTHFSNSIDKNYTIKQYERFIEITNFIKEQGFKVGILHCCNSTAFIKYPNMHLDAVRLGSIIQGRTLIKIGGLKKIGEFQTSISEIKEVPKGYNIGYGNTYCTKQKSKIAIIPVGHSDGFEIRNKRDNFNFIENIKSIVIEMKKIFKKENAIVMINKNKYKVVGRIGLNYSVIDITNSKEITLKEKVFLSTAPLNINSKIRREYI